MFDREAPVRHLASATLRGLAGHALHQHYPELIDRWFKPGHNGNQPPAYLFQALNQQATLKSYVPFRIITWDPDGELIDAFYHALNQWQGNPYGESGACLLHIEWEPIQDLQFQGIINSPPVQQIIFNTPARIRQAGRWIDEKEMNLEYLVRAIIQRLNRLSDAYGTATRLHLQDYMEDIRQAEEFERQLRYVQPKRRSSTQKRNIYLCGLVGTLVYQQISSKLTNLLYTSGVFHVGKHTAEGCGHILLAKK